MCPTAPSFSRSVCLSLVILVSANTRVACAVTSCHVVVEHAAAGKSVGVMSALVSQAILTSSACFRVLVHSGVRGGSSSCLWIGWLVIAAAPSLVTLEKTFDT